MKFTEFYPVDTKYFKLVPDYLELICANLYVKFNSVEDCAFKENET